MNYIFQRVLDGNVLDANELEYLTEKLSTPDYVAIENLFLELYTEIDFNKFKPKYKGQELIAKLAEARAIAFPFEQLLKNYQQED